MKLNQKIDTTKIKAEFINLDGSAVETTLGLIMFKNGNKELSIRATPETNQLDSATLKITFEDKYDIRAEENDLLFMAQSSVQITPISYYKPESEKTFVSVTKKLSLGADIILLLSTIFSVSTALSLIKLTQMLEFLLLLNVVYPSNLSSFLHIISTNVFDKFPNLIGILTDNTCEITLDRFVEEDVSCQIFANLGSYAILLIALMFAKIILSLFSYLFKQNKIVSLSSHLAKKLGARFWMEVFEGIQLDIFMSLFLGIIGKSGSHISGLNFFIAGGLTLAWGLFNAFLIFSIQNLYHLRLNSVYTSDSKRNRQDEEFYKKIVFFVEEYNKKTFFQRNYRPINNFKDILISFCLVIFYTNPLFQIGTIIALMSVTTALSVIYKPLKETKSHIVMVIKDCIFCLCCVMMFLIRILETKLSKQIMYNFMGNLTIAFICVLFTFKLGVAVYNSIQNCRELIQERFCKKKNKVEEKVKPKPIRKAKENRKRNKSPKRSERNPQDDSNLSGLMKRREEHSPPASSSNESEEQKEEQERNAGDEANERRLHKNLKKHKPKQTKRASQNQNDRMAHSHLSKRHRGSASDQDRSIGIIPMKRSRRNHHREKRRRSRGDDVKF